MKIIRSALLIMAIACSVYAGDIQYGVTAADEIPNGVTAAGEMQNGVTTAGDIPFNDTLLNLLLILL
jgi:hypothetical protein